MPKILWQVNFRATPEPIFLWFSLQYVFLSKLTLFWINFFMLALCRREIKRQKLTVRAKETTYGEVPVLVILK